MMKRALGMVVLAALAGAAAAQPRAYDEYEASQRLRLPAETCGALEDGLGAYCVRRCDRGYRAVAETARPRRCRSLEALPPGTRVQAPRKQVGKQPVPPARPVKDVAGF